VISSLVEYSIYIGSITFIVAIVIVVEGEINLLLRMGEKFPEEESLVIGEVGHAV
jgi:hypothetical protein